MDTIFAPLRVKVTKQKWFVFNLNQYRNAHYHILNKAKILYKEALQSQIEGLPNYGDKQIIVHYMLFTKDKRLCDLDNVLAIHSKFFQDALVECKKISDDTYQNIVGSTFEFGEIDKENPRVEIKLREYKK